jgi:hypothetical protein
MFLKEYFFAKLIEPNVEGGTTKPCLFELKDENGNSVGNFFVKIFTQRMLSQAKMLNQANLTAFEFCAAVIASEFDLKTPEFAIVYISDAIIKMLTDDYDYKDIEPGYYFASKAVVDVEPYDNQIFNQKINIDYQKRIFFFDVIIQNRDRRDAKPNILLHQTDCYLIDHEMAFDIQAWQNRALDKVSILKNIVDLPNRAHICLDNLKKAIINEPDLLEELTEYLRCFDFCNLNNLCIEIKQFKLGNIQPIITYLREIFSDISNYLTLIKLLLQ